VPRIFINYRREDASGHAGRLYDALAGRFGREQVFMDVDAIRPGENFATVLDDSVTSCDFLIALIGRRWMSVADRDGRPRLERPEDYVRLELQTALTSPHTHVIPALVQGAEMPASDDLPSPVRSLALRQAVELSDLRWRSDVDRLLRHLDADAPHDAAASGSARAPRATPGRRAPVAMALAAVVALAALAAVLVPGHSSPPHRSAGVPRPVKHPTSKPSPPRVRFASFATNGFQAQLPRGRGWSAPATSEPNPGRLFRTTVRGPDGAFVFVDATPGDKPVFTGTFTSRRHVGQTAFGSAVRYVFRDGGTFPECRASRCIDDQISVPGSPGGLAVLAGGPHFALTRRLASTVTASLTPADG
jgi:TIR domain